MRCRICGEPYDPAAAPTHCSVCGAQLPEREAVREPETAPAPDLTPLADASPPPAPLPPARPATRYRVVADWRPALGFTTTQQVEQDGVPLVVHRCQVEGPTQALDAKAALFQQECAFLQGLRHPGLPTLIEYAADGHEFTLVTDYPGGATLRERVQPPLDPGRVSPLPNPPPSLDDIVEWMRQLGQALLTLHSQQPFPLIHGDIQPDTLLLTRTGDIQLRDFSCLRSVAGESLAAADIATDVVAFGQVLDFLLSAGAATAGVLPPDGAEGGDPRRREVARIARRCQAAPPDAYPSLAAALTDLARLNQRAGVEARELVCGCGAGNRRSLRFCARCGALLHPAPSGDAAPVPTDRLSFDTEGQSSLAQNYEQGHFAPLTRFLLWQGLDELQSDPGFDTLLCLDALTDVHKLPHQQEAALRVLRLMRGRALLADEVGLGKTIEAALVLKELIERDLVTNVLVLCPPSITLTTQWQSEMYEKFNEVFLVMQYNIDTTLAWHCPRLIAPYSILEQRAHAEAAMRRPYDLVILDEAHYLNDPANIRSLRAIQALRKKYFLLLSATPMHNDLKELYNIITLLRPGHFGAWDDFKAAYVDPSRPDGVQNVAELRGVLQQVMIRNIGTEVMERYQKAGNRDFRFPRRTALRRPIDVPVNTRAWQFYQDFRAFYRAQAAQARNRNFLYSELAELVERLTSSRPAFRECLENRRNVFKRQLGQAVLDQLWDFDRAYPNDLVQPKVAKALEEARKYVAQGRKVLVFSQFNATTKWVYSEYIRGTDLEGVCHLYDENALPEVKVQALRNFARGHAGILLCPGEISEGVNLQFANVMINLDLPWDPMKIEQRIGRIQRLGSPFDEVVIINVTLTGTIEDDIVEILEHKLRMFEAVIGKVEEIIGNLSEGDDFRAMIADLFIEAKPEETSSASDSAARLDKAIREAEQRAQDNKLLTDVFAGAPPVDDEIDWN